MAEDDEWQDICLNCGNQLKSKLWGAKCNCNTPNVVQQQPCDGCNRLMGEITDDDYCVPGKLDCPDCVDKARK